MDSMNRLKFFRNSRGFTLLELMVVMGIFVTVIMISAAAFNTIVNRSSQQSKSAETEIGGIVGLELLRSDLEHAGFGLPWVFQTPITYSEAVDTVDYPHPFWPSGRKASSFNDAVAGAPGNAPRAIQSGITTFNTETFNTETNGSVTIGSNYLVIKSTLADVNDTSKKWTTVSYNDLSAKAKKDWGTSDRDLAGTERVIVVKNSLMTTPPTRQLMAQSSTLFSSPFNTYSTQGLLAPHQNGDTFEIYGINPDTDLRMPFNRADYYVWRPDNISKSCMNNSGVGVLYKSAVIHGTSGTTPGTLTAGMPLLDCVADMQVVYGLDSDGAGRVNQYMDATTDTSTLTAQDIRNQLREIRVYILAQEGKRDLIFTYPSETVTVGETLNGQLRGRVFNLKNRLGLDYKNYRWKVYTIVVRPKNLVQ